MSNSSLIAAPPVAAAVTPLARRLLRLLQLLLVAAAVTPLAPTAFAQPRTRDLADPDVRATAPIKNFRLPTFTDEGHRSTTLRAAEARMINNDRVEVFGVELTVFTEDALNDIDTVFTTPFAVVSPSKEHIAGNDTVHLKRPDFEATGANWSYDHNEKRVIIRRDAHFIFQAQLKDIIK